MSDSELSPPPTDDQLDGIGYTLATTGTTRIKTKGSLTRTGRKRKAEALASSPKTGKRTKTGPGQKVVKEHTLVKGESSPLVTDSVKTTRIASKKKTGVKITEEPNFENTEVQNESGVVENRASKKGRERKAKIERAIKEEAEITEQPQVNGELKAKIKRKRKTKEEKEAEMQPIAARTVGCKVLVGAHVSAAGGVHNAVVNSHHIGGNAFALFLKSQRKWANPELKSDHCSQYLSHCKTHGFTQDCPPIVPHGSYLVNLAHPDRTRGTQAYDSFIDDLDRCTQLGIKLYNFHPGNSAASESKPAAIKQLATQLNRAHKDPRSGQVITLLETMAAVGGNTIGSTFADLGDVISHIDDRSRVGVCLDTCHIFAAGYDVRTPAAWAKTLAAFDSAIGLRYLRALHVNDSKAPLGSGRDLHANIGTGFLGLRAFHAIVNDKRVWGLPLILETPIDRKDSVSGKTVEDKTVWAREIKLLESLVGMDVESKEFKKLESELSEQGEGERKRIQEQVDKRKVKAKKNAKGRGKKGKKEEGSGTESESSSALSELEGSDLDEGYTQKLE